ncbi:MAG: (deoxy)nucleoside triphosphate pyrophosphohydrolase [Alphaproteobacteria bacterium]|nr:(deoxy)nucleoside triphosphate pyrophosphohydrolase [Alphaproteobacteria bacterium]
MKRRLRVVGAVAVVDGRVFLAQRPPGGRHGGLWEFPGGKVEPGESDAQALARELREELAVDATVGELVAVGRDDVIELWCYRVELHGTPRPQEAQATGWFTPRQLAGLPTPPADVPALSALGVLADAPEAG